MKETNQSTAGQAAQGDAAQQVCACASCCERRGHDYPEADMQISSVSMHGMGKYLAVTAEETPEGGNIVLSGKFVRVSTVNSPDTVVMSFTKPQAYQEFLDFVGGIAA